LTKKEFTMDRRDISDILDSHDRWRVNPQEGQRAAFERVDLRGFDFAGRALVGVQLVGCDLRGASLRQCNLSFAYFVGCDLREADLRGATATGVSFQRSDLRGADLRDFYARGGSSFMAADLRGARMEGMHLRKSDLVGAWVSAEDLRAGVGFEECFSPCGAELHGTVGPDWSLADLHVKLQRPAPDPGFENSPIVAALELGSGPALLDRLQAAQEQERQGQVPRLPRRHER
jgi:hypothetical protein